MPLPVPLTSPLHLITWAHPPTSITYVLKPTPTVPTLSLVSSSLPAGTFASLQVHTLPLEPLFTLTPSQLQRTVSRSSADADAGGIDVRRAAREMADEVGFVQSGAERGREEDGARTGWGWEWRGGEDYRLFGLGTEAGSV